MVKTFARGGLGAALGALLATGAATTWASESADGWEYELTVYAWAKSIKGTSGESDIDLNFRDDIVDLLDGAFMASFEADNGLVSLFGAFEYSNIGDDGRIEREFEYTIPPIGPTVPITAGAKIDFTEKEYVGELGAGYTVAQVAGTRWQLLGGAKYFANDSVVKLKNVTVTPPVGDPIPLDGRKIHDHQDWWHPFLGLRVAAQLSDHWRLRARGDYGYLESDNTSWMLEALVDWRFNDWGALEFGYRHMEIDYESGSDSSPYRYDVEETGPRFGLIIHF